MSLIKRDLIRFVLIGGFSNLINFTLYFVINSLFDSLLLASVMGYLFGLYFSFHFGRIWVFGKIFNNSYTNLTRFILVYLFGLILMSSLIEIMTNYFLIDYKISWLVAACFVFCTNFIGSKWIVFK
jgi:putative flippase GtrA